MVLALAILIGRWDYNDQWKVRRYLHRDMLRKGKDASEPLFRHINAIVDSVGIKDGAGEDYCGDSDEEEIEDWYEKQAELKANSSFLRGGDTGNGNGNGSEMKSGDKEGDDEHSQSQTCSEDGYIPPLSPLAVHLPDIEDEDEDEDKDEEVAMAHKAQLPGQLTGTKHMDVLSHLGIEEEEAAEEARRTDLLALEWHHGEDSDDEGVSKASSATDDALEDNIDILNDHKRDKKELEGLKHDLVVVGSDHFARYYSLKVDYFLKQALHLTGSVYQVCTCTSFPPSLSCDLSCYC